jgi:type IV pilus assembly protein PilM
MKAYPAWGVDLTAVAVRAVQIALGPEGRPRIVAWDIVDYTEQVPDVTSLTRFGLMERGLQHFRGRHDLRSSRVWYSLRAETAFNRTVVIPPVTDEGVDRLLELEAQQQIPFPISDVFWDRRVVGIRDGGEIHATIYAVRRQVLEDRLRKLQRIGMPVDGIQLRPLALQNFCAEERLLEEGTVVVDIDYGGLQILIHHDDQTWFRVLPMGAAESVALIERSFQIPHATAVRIASGELEAPDPVRFVTLRKKAQGDIVSEVARVVRYYASARPGVQLRRIVLFESHPCVMDCEEALAAALGIPVHRPRGFRSIEVEPDVVSAGIQEHFPALAKAAGLALQGVGRAQCQVRLFPPELERVLGGGRAGYVAAAAILLATILLAVLRLRTRDTELLDALGSAKSFLAEARLVQDLERAAGLDAIDRRLGEWRAAFRGRDRLVRIADHLMATAAAIPPEERPALAGLSLGEGPSAGIVLAWAGGEESEADRLMDRLARSTVDGAWITAAEAGEAWTGETVSPSAPEHRDLGDVILPVRHRRYRLVLGEGR